MEIHECKGNKSSCHKIFLSTTLIYNGAIRTKIIADENCILKRDPLRNLTSSKLLYDNVNFYSWCTIKETIEVNTRGKSS
ncbi:unnamed protein product [Rhizophagus irregularis]|nr:unnamed protein product [Rhizophagus irregularis]